jgi:outer membrane protein
MTTAILSLDAQIKKGRFFISGSNSMELQGGTSKDITNDDESTAEEDSYFYFGFQPRVGFLFLDNFAAGLFIDADYASAKDKSGGGYQKKSTTFLLGPFARYYLPVGKKLVPFIEGQAGLGAGVIKESHDAGEDWDIRNMTAFSYRMGAGITLFFSRMVGADLSIGYSHESNKYKADDETSNDETTQTLIYNEIIMQIGIVIIID